MSHFANYIKEREDKQILENEKGFATYKIYDNGECYLQDIYVAPEFRKQHVGSGMVDRVSDIARKHDCHTLIGSICLDDKNATKNMQIWLGYGFQLYKNVGTMIFLRKDLRIK